MHTHFATISNAANAREKCKYKSAAIKNTLKLCTGTNITTHSFCIQISQRRKILNLDSRDSPPDDEPLEGDTGTTNGGHVNI